MAKRKVQAKKAKRINRDLTTVNIIFSVLALVINLMMWWSIYSVTRYSSFSKIVFIVINIVVLLLMLTMNYLLFMLIRTKKVTFMNTVSAMLVVFLLVGTFATYATTRINVNVNKITNTGSKNEKVETSLVVYSATGSSSITDINGLDGKTVGYVEGANDGTMALDELTAKNINATTVPYSDYITLAQALFAGEIDCAALPSNYVGLLEVNDGFTEYLDNTTAISTFDKVIKVETETGSTKDITKDPFTVLIIGVDEGRSDAIMVASFNPISLNVTLSSIARDSYVPIACYSGKGSDKIGHARARNRQCTIDTVEDLLDIDIDYYFESNFNGVIKMVDALGGIVVNNPIEFVGQNASTERGHYTVWVPAGENVPLNGEQALAFARERHKYATGDFQRQANQQQVIQAILRQVMRLRDVNKGLAMVEAAGENISTNMSVDQLISLFNYSMKKASRYYDKSSLENVFNIIGSRVTGYSDGIWNEGLQQSLYIYRLYEGAINDTHDAIIRNTDMNSKITAPKSIKWDATWEFTAPVIANEAYSGEVKIQTIPDNLPKFTTLGKLQAWAKPFGITVNVQEIGEGMEGYDANLADGTIIWQDVSAGTPAASISVINVKVIKKAAKVTACPTNSTGTYPDCVCTANTDGKTHYDKNSNTCTVPNGKEYTLTVKYTVKDNGATAPATYTDKVKEGATYSVTSPSLSGYTPDKGTVSGIMPGKDYEVIVTYQKSGTAEAKKHTVTVTYTMSDGSKAPNPISQTIAEGATYSITSPTVTGYSPSESTVSGTMGTTDINKAVTYTLNTEQHDDKGVITVISEATCIKARVVQKTCSLHGEVVGSPYEDGAPNPEAHKWKSTEDKTNCVINYVCELDSNHTKQEPITGCIVGGGGGDGESNPPSNPVSSISRNLFLSNNQLTSSILFIGPLKK